MVFCCELGETAYLTIFSRMSKLAKKIALVSKSLLAETDLQLAIAHKSFQLHLGTQTSRHHHHRRKAGMQSIGVAS